MLDYATAFGLKNGLLTDSQCGYLAFSANTMNVLIPAESSPGVESQMLLEAQERGLRVNEVLFSSANITCGVRSKEAGIS